MKQIVLQFIKDRLAFYQRSRSRNVLFSPKRWKKPLLRRRIAIRLNVHKCEAWDLSTGNLDLVICGSIHIEGYDHDSMLDHLAELATTISSRCKGISPAQAAEDVAWFLHQLDVGRTRELEALTYENLVCGPQGVCFFLLNCNCPTVDVYVPACWFSFSNYKGRKYYDQKH